MHTYGVPRGCTVVFNSEWDFQLFIIPLTESKDNIVVYDDAYGNTEAKRFNQEIPFNKVLEAFGQSYVAQDEGAEMPGEE